MPHFHYDKDEIKNNLDIESVASLVSHFGGEPMIRGESFIAKTICHNDFGEGSHKLYYYDNTNLFICYTQCDERTFDIFELVIKIKKIQEDIEWGLPQAMAFVAAFFGIAATTISDENQLEDWKILQNYDRIEEVNLDTREVSLKTYDKKILKYFPQPRILPWEEEGILPIVMKMREIAYNPSTGGIIIPHFDMHGNLIGIRERTLLKDNEKYGKYHPSIIQGIQYSHPLGFNLYGLDKSKDNIRDMKTAIIVEAEKSVLLYESYFGIQNSLVCATCGSSLINFQFQLLMDLGVNEIIIGFDKDWEVKNDENFNKVVKKLKSIDKKYGGYVQISFLFDKENLLKYKQSPLDAGAEIFQQLYQNRIIL